SGKQRLSKLKREASTAAKHDAEEQNLHAAIDQLEKFGQRVREGLHEADWNTRRDILRALIKQVEVGTEAIRVVYKVTPRPFDPGPSGGRSQHCWRGGRSSLWRSFMPLDADAVLHQPRFQKATDDPQQ